MTYNLQATGIKISSVSQTTSTYEYSSQTNCFLYVIKMEWIKKIYCWYYYYWYSSNKLLQKKSKPVIPEWTIVLHYAYNSYCNTNIECWSRTYPLLMACSMAVLPVWAGRWILLQMLGLSLIKYSNYKGGKIKISLSVLDSNLSIALAIN